jgi:hypothetical protein
MVAEHGQLADRDDDEGLQVFARVVPRPPDVRRGEEREDIFGAAG